MTWEQWPIRGQYSGHVISADQSEASSSPPDVSVITIREATGAMISFPRMSIIWHLSWLWILKIFIKSNHNIVTATSSIKGQAFNNESMSKKIFIDRKSLKRVHFGAGGLSVHFQLAPRLFLIRTPHQLKSVVIISLNDSGLTKDSGKCTHSVEINCPICRERKGWKVLLDSPSIYFVLVTTTCNFW